jgi:hypothetical protein
LEVSASQPAWEGERVGDALGRAFPRELQRAMVLLLTGGLGGPRNRDCPRHQPLDRLPLMSRREVRVARDHAQGLLPAELLDREEVHLFHRQPRGEGVVRVPWGRKSLIPAPSPDSEKSLSAQRRSVFRRLLGKIKVVASSARGRREIIVRTLDVMATCRASPPSSRSSGRDLSSRPPARRAAPPLPPWGTSPGQRMEDGEAEYGGSCSPRTCRGRR